MKEWLLDHSLWIILCVAVLLRLPLLNGSFWLDEAAQALESVRPFSQQLDIIGDFQPPLLHSIVHGAAQFSVSEWWLRLWGALIPGLVTVWATYRLGKKLFGHQAGFAAALLLATSSFHIFYSQELRPYSLPAMWAMLSLLLLFSAQFRWRQFAAVSVLGLYSSYLYPFLLLPQFWILLKNPETKKHLLKIGAAILAFSLPWLPVFLQQLETGQQLRAVLPGWETVVSTPQFKTLLLVPGKFLYGVLNTELSLPFIFPALIVGLLLLLSWKPKVQKKKLSLTYPEGKILFLLVATFLLSWLVSFFIPVVQPKRLLFLLPAFYLLITAPLHWKQAPQLFARLLVVLLLSLNIVSVWRYWTDPLLQRENWRGLKQEITERFPVQETLAVFVFEEAFAPWRWYQPETVSSLSLSPDLIKDESALRLELKALDNYRYVLVFDYLRDLTDPDNVLPAAIEQYGFQGRGVIDYPNIGFVRIYTRPGNAIGYRE